ncbi:hypothetical protein PP724_22955 [Ralstonia solanacearum]|uniref:hypothetical protein n=1 Tax=Ralstonia solanacearum TaxID=305 RepID=UPI001FF7037A|nr:hypothetical protein [Ralstonia solanacearum]MDC6237027.1 hypothetical protein [Ralstonia solanacearum]MDD7810570.1 hypothetical protein [Ralstonia solanacearum]
MNKKHLIAFLFGLVAAAGAHAETATAVNTCKDMEMPYQHVGTDSQITVGLEELRDGKSVYLTSHMEGVETRHIPPSVKRVRVRVCIDPIFENAAPTATK